MSTQVKELIAPLQMLLIKKGICAGCMSGLKDGKKIIINETSEKIICKCGRIYILNTLDDVYRRALIEEA